MKFTLEIDIDNGLMSVNDATHIAACLRAVAMRLEVKQYPIDCEVSRGITNGSNIVGTWRIEK